VSTESPEKRLIQAGRKTRDALRAIRDIVRGQRKADLYNQIFADLDGAVEDATDGLIEISNVFEQILQSNYKHEASEADVSNLHSLQRSLASMKLERDELVESLQDAQEQLQKYADDLQKLYAKEREKRAELSVAYDRLQEADRLKSDFLHTINHELSSPLVPIDLSMQLIEKGELDDEQLKNLNEAKKMMAQYKRQLDGLIIYASLVNQSHMVRPEPLDFKHLLDDTLMPLQMLAQGRNISINLEPVPEELQLVADADLISSALYQLVHNAIKFNRPGGFVELLIFEEDSGVTFQVTDDGLGISDEVIDKIGQAFNQIVDAMRRGVEGLGLGLAFANYVANAHEGKLSARRGPEKGSIIQLWIPHAANGEIL
jgi:signal transduction histidine kinase